MLDIPKNFSHPLICSTGFTLLRTSKRGKKKKKIQDHIECPFLAVEHRLHYHTQMAMELQSQVSIASMWEEGNRSQSSQPLFLWHLESSVDFYKVDWFESWKEIPWSHQYALRLWWRLMCSRPSHWWTCLSGCTGLGWTYLMSKDWIQLRSSSKSNAVLVWLAFAMSEGCGLLAYGYIW